MIVEINKIPNNINATIVVELPIFSNLLIIVFARHPGSQGKSVYLRNFRLFHLYSTNINTSVL